MKVRKAVIPAAGLGTRFLPATKALPKEMLPIVDKPTIQFIVEEVAAAGISDILIITGRGKKAIEDHFDRSCELEDFLAQKGEEELLSQVRSISEMVNIHYIRQKEPKGLGHAVHCAKSFVGDEPFAVLLGDDVVKSDKPCILQMIEVFERYDSSILGVQHVQHDDVSKYGIVDCESIGGRVYKVKDMVEKPDKDKAPSDIAILGRYIITPRIFELLENAEPGKGGEIQLTDALKRLSEEEPVYAYDFIGRRYDVGNRLGFLQATVEFALERNDLKKDFASYLRGITERL